MKEKDFYQNLLNRDLTTKQVANIAAHIKNHAYKEFFQNVGEENWPPNPEQFWKDNMEVMNISKDHDLEDILEWEDKRTEPRYEFDPYMLSIKAFFEIFSDEKEKLYDLVIQILDCSKQNA